MQRSGQGYSIAVPSSWKYVDASIPSDHSTFLYTDPNNALRKLQVVVSGCSGCVMNVQDTNDTSLHPENVVPQGASTYRISQRKIAFETYTDGEPYPDNGIIIAATDGYVEADLWLPDSEHATATRILNSFQGP